MNETTTTTPRGDRPAPPSTRARLAAYRRGRPMLTVARELGLDANTITRAELGSPLKLGTSLAIEAALDRALDYRPIEQPALDQFRARISRDGVVATCRALGIEQTDLHRAAAGLVCSPALRKIVTGEVSPPNPR